MSAAIATTIGVVAPSRKRQARDMPAGAFIKGLGPVVATW